VAADFLQFRRLFTDRGVVHPGSTLVARNGASAAGFNQKKRQADAPAHSFPMSGSTP